MSSQFYCANCQSTDFYKDDQGYFICQYCGIMSQDHYAETNDMEDGAVTSNVRRVYDRSKAINNDKKSVSSQSSPVLLRFLEVYQYCLKLLLSRMLEVVEIEQSDKVNYFNTLKYLWMDYLKAWKRSECTCNMLQAFAAVTDGHCTCPPNDMKHPLFPSKPLLMGFVYLTLRIHRSWVTPAEMVHCCLSGRLPYSNLWEHIPEEYRLGRVDAVYRGFFTDQHLGPTRFISCSNILFHASSIAETVAIAMPPLNDPFIACVVIQRLGLPGCVWSRYCQLAQVYSERGGQSIFSATSEEIEESNRSQKRGRKSKRKPAQGSASDRSEVHYVEEILIMIIMAVKCCSGWQKWPIVRNSGEIDTASRINLDSSIVSFDSEVTDAVPRKDLKVMLERIRSCVPSYTTYRAINPSKHAYTFNQAVSATLESEYYTPVVSSSSSSSSGGEGAAAVAAEEPSSTLSSTSTSVKMSEVVYEPGSVFEVTKSELGSGQKTGSRKSSSSNGAIEEGVEEEEGVCSYITYARYDHSTALREGGQFDLPSTLLLERVACWALVPVSLLHKLLLEREEVLVRLLLSIRNNL